VRGNLPSGWVEEARPWGHYHAGAPASGEAGAASCAPQLATIESVVSDTPAEPPRKQPQVQVVVPDALKHGEYANFLVVSHSPHDFTLDFCQLLPSNEQGTVNAEVVSRVRIAPTMVARVLNALNTNLSNYEDRFGQVKALG
jgi:hypothetical protein